MTATTMLPKSAATQLLGLDDAVSEAFPGLGLPSIREPLLAKPDAEILDVATEDGVHESAVARAEELVEEAVGQGVLSVVGLALGAAETGEIDHVVKSEGFAVAGVAKEVVDEVHVGVTLVGAEGNVGTGEGGIVLDNTQSVKIVEIDPATSLVDHVSRSGKLIGERRCKVVGVLNAFGHLLVRDVLAITGEDSVVGKSVQSSARGAGIVGERSAVLGPDATEARSAGWYDLPGGTIREDEREDGVEKVAGMELDNEGEEGNQLEDDAKDSEEDADDGANEVHHGCCCCCC